MAQVFISYSRKDKDFVQRLVGALIAEEREVWLDETNIEPTAEWLKEIFKNIEAADNFVFVISPDSVVSTYARKEIDHAALNNKRIVPIFYQPVPDKDIPEAVAKFQRIDFSGSDDFHAKISQLIAALDTDLDWKQEHARLLIRAKEWERGTDSSFLLRGKDLRAAEQWVVKSDEKAPKPTTLHSQYILASRQATTRRLWALIGTFAVLLLVAVVAGIYYFREKTVAVKNEVMAKEQEKAAKANEATAQRNARESRARALAAYASQSLGVDPERSIVLAMHAVNATLQFGQLPLPAAEDALHEAILSSRERFHLMGDNGWVRSVAWSRDGKRLATGSNDNTVKVWHAASGHELRTLRGHAAPVLSVSWSWDGQRLATGSWDGTAKVWAASSGKELLTLRGHGSRVLSVDWSPDGRWISSRIGTCTSASYSLPIESTVPAEVRRLFAYADELLKVSTEPMQADTAAGTVDF